MAPEQRAAIVGTGPAGRAAAREFVKAGWGVTMFEKEPEAGGLMRYGFPDFRMPTKVSHRDAAQLADLGVNIRFGQELGGNLSLADLEDDFQAVVLAVGSSIPRRLQVPGEDAPGVYDAINFLHANRSGHPLPVGRRVLVVGGGDTSLDAAIIALDQGAAQAEVLYRGPAEAVRALAHEQRFAQERGVRLRYHTIITLIAAGAESLAVRLQSTDSGQEATEPWDTVIVAIGQERNTKFLTSLGLTVGADGRTDHPRVWVAGDVAYGSDRLAKAILDGRRVAQAITAA